MSEIWDKMIECESAIIEKCSALGEETFDDPEFGWLNRVFRGEHFRRAHIDSVDARDSKGLYMTHICVFPNYDNDAPIYGFDIICGKNKVTGAFHDYSPTADWNHPMVNLFGEFVQDLEWKKERQLPDWAQAIFSKHMVAASNVRIEEMQQVVTMALDNLDTYSIKGWCTIFEEAIFNAHAPISFANSAPSLSYTERMNSIPIFLHKPYNVSYSLIGTTFLSINSLYFSVTLLPSLA